ncbi:helix-turn-helix transcriptional regulator [Schaedlerella arabinosiphila]|uniref:Helix-turn-helix transcriptional regulator n=1 Tax=Schaedlerella arabinosiphila TaxID=2044587 RepID=A0A9X5H4J1_9FIRM|nr:helix-turn-helix transcriptional regulator [Schaedlerella arabinosiphila]NDO67314.1 helix-turn-helix transcriptional regulator [Schaedlerella arabinosiphila]
MGMTNKIKALCAMRGITQQELADKLNTPQSNLSKKYKKDDWRESDLQKIAEVLNADFKGCFILNETDEQF